MCQDSAVLGIVLSGISFSYRKDTCKSSLPSPPPPHLSFSQCLICQPQPLREPLHPKHLHPALHCKTMCRNLAAPFLARQSVAANFNNPLGSPLTPFRAVLISSWDPLSAFSMSPSSFPGVRLRPGVLCCPLQCCKNVLAYAKKVWGCFVGRLRHWTKYHQGSGQGLAAGRTFCCASRMACGTGGLTG